MYAYMYMYVLYIYMYSVVCMSSYYYIYIMSYIKKLRLSRMQQLLNARKRMLTYADVC